MKTTDPVIVRFLRDFHVETIKAHWGKLMLLQVMCQHPSADNGQCPDCGKLLNEEKQ